MKLQKRAREGPGEIGSELFSNKRKKTELKDQRQRYLFLQAGRRRHWAPLPRAGVLCRVKPEPATRQPLRANPGRPRRQGGRSCRRWLKQL